MDANTLRRLNYLWKYRHDHQDDTTEAQLTEIRVTINEIVADMGIPLLTTKGDLHGFDIEQARIPVGADGTVLTANSAETLGVEWATAGSGGAAVPTVIVAAVDTVFAGGVDYTCDGTDDDVTIETAMAAVSPGGRVVLTDGTFTCGATINFTLSPDRGGVTLEGMGVDATIITKANSVNVDVIASSDNVAYNRIANLSINGNKANCTAGSGINWWGDYLWVDNVRIYDCDTHGITTLAGSQYHFITNSIFQTNVSDGLNLNGSTASVIGCVSSTNGRYGYYLNGADQSVTGCSSLDNVNWGYFLNESYARVVGNFSTNDELGILSGPGLNTIIGNVIVGSDTSGIQLQDTSRDTVIGNIILNVGQYGIILSAADNCLVASNLIIAPGQDANNTYDGIRVHANCDYSYIHGNRIVGNAGTPKPQYGVNVAAASNNNTHYLANMTGASGDYGTGQYNDAGTGSVNVWPGAAAPQGDNF